MNLSFSELPQDLQDYISSRFLQYGMDPELAYNNLIPLDVKMQGPDMIDAFLRHKHISHVYPVSIFPNLESSLSNIFLEDPQENMSRGNSIASDQDILDAQIDNYADAFDYDFNDDGNLDFGF